MCTEISGRAFPLTGSLARRLLILIAEALEENMKLSREFHDEQQAEARELLLRSEGYQVWKKHAPDGTWQVIWLALESPR